MYRYLFLSAVRANLQRTVHHPADEHILHLHGGHLQRRLLQVHEHLRLQVECHIRVSKRLSAVAVVNPLSAMGDFRHHITLNFNLAYLGVKVIVIFEIVGEMQ